jgi:hypothetical protein
MRYGALQDLLGNRQIQQGFGNLFSNPYRASTIGPSGMSQADLLAMQNAGFID